jgi:nitrilase
MAGDSAFRVAATQCEPVWLDLAATVAKTCHLIKEAAGNGAKLIAFPECWVSGYPIWIWSVFPVCISPVSLSFLAVIVLPNRGCDRIRSRPIDFETSVKYTKNSLAIDSTEMRELCDCAKENGIAVVLGFSENDHDSLYISQAIISSTGEILKHRRKFKPTHMERTVFGDASGGSLKNVMDIGMVKSGSKKNIRVSSLMCWVCFR